MHLVGFTIENAFIICIKISLHIFVSLLNNIKLSHLLVGYNYCNVTYDVCSRISITKSNL